MPKFIIMTFNILSWLTFSVITRTFYRINQTTPQNINQLKRGCLIISNHQSMLDPFILTARIPFLKMLSIIPGRFPVCHKFMNNPFLSTFLKLFGCFDIGQTKKENMLALFYMRQLLQEKQSLFLFPEGKLCKKGNIETFKKGVEFLINESENVVFVKIDFINKIKWSSPVSKCNLVFSPVKNFDHKLTSNELESFFKQL